MKSWAVAAVLLAAVCARADDAAPTIRSALEAADAATARDVPATAADVDEREAALRELEFRIDRMHSARDQMQQALGAMAADPKVDPKLPALACKAAGSAFRDPYFAELVRARIKALEKPEIFKLLTPGQAARLSRIKESFGELESRPDIDCAKL